jgi:hypothetical protein
MTVRQESGGHKVAPTEPTTLPATQVQASINRLRMRQEALRQQAAQLQARAEHLERVHAASAQRLARRIDAHEKIVLGALVKKAGLDWSKPGQASQTGNTRLIDGVKASNPLRLSDLSTSFDRELILGSLLWLVSALNAPPNGVVSVPSRQRLRDDGAKALDTGPKDH